VLSAFPSAAAGAASAGDIAVETNQTTIAFPNTITFQVKASSSADIKRIVLEYGVDMLTCGEVVAKAFPDFTPSGEVSANWTWDMRQSGSEPPGARIWWQWRITDADGNETVTERKETVWLDSTHPWKSQTQDLVTLHWYQGSQSYGEDLLNSAVGALQRIDQLVDLRPDANIDLYIYGTFEDLRDAVLYEAGWTGGLSFGEKNVIILAIPSGEEDWGKGAIAHELMHTVVDRNTFSCLVRIPAWVHEGLAMISEGGLGAVGMNELQSAIDDDSIFPLHSLGGGFPEDPDQAVLAYDQSFSVVDYLIQQGDPSQMKDLLAKLRDGYPVDDAVQQVYGFNVDGLDAAWRKSVGAKPLEITETGPTPTPTYVPTLQLLSINPEGATPAPVTPGAKTPASKPTATQVESGSKAASNIPWGIIIPAVCIGLLCLAMLAGMALFLAARLAGRKS
jgi:hypothetical protein